MLRNATDWYSITKINAIDSPALLVYKDRVIQNIQTLIAMIDDPYRLRPHVKTHKCAEVTLMLMKAGIKKFKCATIAEAEMLGLCGAPDVLLAYQPVGPKLRRLVELTKRYPKTLYSCLVDSRVIAMEISKTFGNKKRKLSVYVDLNVGLNRTGIAPDANAFALYIDLYKMAGIYPAGLHVYDGHLRSPDLQDRRTGCDGAFKEVLLLKEQLMRAGMPEPAIIAGCSPTFSIHAKSKQVECSPGTFIYWDQGYSYLCAEQPFVPAALVLTRIISLPDPTKICVDLGHKSIASENDLSRRVWFINAPELVPVFQNEEHLVLEASAGHSFRVGDVLYGIPWHICPTVALYESTWVVSGHRIVGAWEVMARGRKINV